MIHIGAAEIGKFLYAPIIIILTRVDNLVKIFWMDVGDGRLNWVPASIAEIYFTHKSNGDVNYAQFLVVSPPWDRKACQGNRFLCTLSVYVFTREFRLLMRWKDQSTGQLTNLFITKVLQAVNAQTAPHRASHQCVETGSGLFRTRVPVRVSEYLNTVMAILQPTFRVFRFH